MGVDEFNGHRLYTGLTLDYRLRLLAPTSASCAVSEVAELLVKLPTNMYRILNTGQPNCLHTLQEYAQLTSILSNHCFL